MRGKAEANPQIPHIARNRLRNLKQNNEIATPFGLAMTFSEGSKCKPFHAPLNNFPEMEKGIKIVTVDLRYTDKVDGEEEM